MTSPIEVLYDTKNGGEISHEQCQEINKALASIELSDIPKEQYNNVIDYLVNALNHETVQEEITTALNNLLSELQDIA